jgi:tungstate transport system permease protein
LFPVIIPFDMQIDPEIFQITLLSLQVSILATLLSLLLGLPLGTLLALGRFPGRSFLLALSTPEWVCRLWLSDYLWQ